MYFNTIQAAPDIGIKPSTAPRSEAASLPHSRPGSHLKGLSFYADFDDGTNARFASGDRRIANPSPNFIFSEGIAGRGLVVSGQQKIPVPDFATENNIRTDRGTIAFWFKPGKEALQSRPAGKQAHWLLSSRSMGQTIDNRFYIFCRPESFAFDYFIHASTKNWLPDTWHHLAVQWNKNEIALFTDGRLAAHKEVKPGWKWGFGHTFTLGGHQNQPRCSGVYDEFIIWDRELEAGEITELYDTGQSGKSFATLVGKEILERNIGKPEKIKSSANAIENGSFEAGTNHRLLIDIPARGSPSHPTFVTQDHHPDKALISDTDAWHGKRALLLNIGPKDAKTGEYRMPRQGTAEIRTLAFRLDPAIKHTLSLRLKVLSPGPTKATIGLDAMRPLEKIPGSLTHTRNIPGDGGDWKRLEVSGKPFKAHDDLYRLRIDITNNGSDTASVLVDAIQVNPASIVDTGSAYYFDNAVTATLNTGRLANIFDFSEPVVLHAIMANQDKQAANQPLELEIYDLWGRRVHQQTINLSMSGHEITRTDIPPGIMDTGLYRATLSRNDSADIVDEITFSVLPETVPNDFMGVHATHDEYTLTVAKRLGIRWNRLWDNGRPTDWPNIQPQSEKHFNWGYSDMVVDDVHKYDFRQLGVISWPQTRWATNWISQTRPHWLHTNWGTAEKPSPPSGLFYDEKFREQWLAYVREVVMRYRGKINYWELLNEPYLYASPRWVMDIYKATVPVIRAANPDARIVGPCLYLRPRWVNELIKLGILDYIDVFSYHGYHMDSSALQQVNKWSSADNIERPVFDTENSALSSSRFFCQSCPGKEFSGFVSPQESALRIVKSMVSALGEGTDTFFFYWMVHYDAYEKHGTFLDHAGGLRSSAVAYALTGWRLRNLEPRSRKLHPGGIQSYSFANPEDTRAVAVLWSTGNRQLPALAGLGNNAVTVYDIMGGRIDTNELSHPALATPGMPVFLEADSMAVLQQELSRLAAAPPAIH